MMITPDSWAGLSTTEMLRWFALGVALSFVKAVFRARKRE